MTGALVLIIYSLAVFRVAIMVALERGPDDVFARLRYWVLKQWPESNNPYAIYWVDACDINPATGKATSWQAEGVKCVACLSFWMAMPAGIAIVGREYWPGLFWLIPDMIACALAVSAGAILIEKLRQRV